MDEEEDSDTEARARTRGSKGKSNGADTSDSEEELGELDLTEATKQLGDKEGEAVGKIISTDRKGWLLKGKGKAVAAMVVNDDSDDDDDDYAPSRRNSSSSDEESSSGHSNVHSTREASPVSAEDIDPEEPAQRQSGGANMRIPERVSPLAQSEKHDMAFLCRWQQDGAQSCQVVVNDRQVRSSR